MTEEAIDLSDIPELNFDSLGKPVMGKFYRPLLKNKTDQISFKVNLENKTD